MTIRVCPLCSASDPTIIFRATNLPVLCNQLWENSDLARTAPTGDVELAACRSCTLIWNRAFDPDRMAYVPGYENALHFSARFRSYADDLAADLVARHGLGGRNIVEIGCGDGHMLDLMVRHGVARATGFDPSMAGRDTPFTSSDRVEIVPEYFSAAHLDRSFDAILCRHVLEHLAAPVSFLRTLRQAAAERAVPIYVEVPNTSWLIESVSIWDVIYEHVTYWMGSSMETLLRRTGFRPHRIEPGFGGQFLQAEGLADRPEDDFVPSPDATVLEAAQAFGTAAEAQIAGWRRLLETLDGPAVVWGAGSKGIAFANLVNGAAGALAALVDVNPRKQGRSVAGAALPVVGPDALSEIRPRLVIIANNLYRDEIRDSVRRLELHPEFAVLVG